ncbi:MAG: hypothetical protein K8H88_02515, partial [Sandaracinaceae bacterium]|nr:hypothetical protein [Sandaracinaceae bacterium]
MKLTLLTTLLATLLALVLGGCDSSEPPPDGSYDAGTTDALRGPGCTDGLLNQNESDVDCGGVCGATCEPGEMCSEAIDCTTRLCAAGTCDVVPECRDGVRGGSETDVDCGGSMCEGCANGRRCTLDRDCATEHCVGGRCAASLCGDGVVQAPETCDDGSGGARAQSATCDVDCTAVQCGDGVVNTLAGEDCDGDGTGTGGETVSCNTDCTRARCGDGLVNRSAGEDCDGDEAGAPGETTTCDADCTTRTCGDGVLNRTAAEQCDDGNGDDTDLCSNACVIHAPPLAITADTTFDTDSGQLGGIVSAGWDGASHTLFVASLSIASSATLTVRGSHPLRIESGGAVDIAGT